MSEKKTGLALLREPFAEHQISKLPKGTKAQNECPSNEKTNCKVCGGWHHPRIIHLDYVGHAALTDRLLDADPAWNWEYVAVGPDGNPTFDKDGGMWIKLTVCGVTRLGYGDAQGKTGGNATKERIGDALRNAAMRFGAALDLWHKGDLHVDTEPEPKAIKSTKTDLPESSKSIGQAAIDSLTDEQRATAQNWSDSIIDAYCSGSADDALEIYEDAKYKHVEETEFLAAVWGKLDSKIRTGIKKAGESRKLGIAA